MLRNIISLSSSCWLRTPNLRVPSWSGYQDCSLRMLASTAMLRAPFKFNSPDSKNEKGTFQPVLGIRRETINLWERRAPLAPSHVRQLVMKGVRVLVQPSNRRTYTVAEYAAVGGEITEDISEATLIMGVKRPVGMDMEDLIPDKTYAFFTHTIKAQQDNMELLDTMLGRNIRLIDYERMLDESGARLVAFGQYAGTAGMINILHGLGIRLLALGHSTPFLHIGLAHSYRSVEQARQAIRDAGYEITLGKLPESLGPMTIVFTGSGNVSIGAQSIFRCLPYEFIEPAHLAEVVKNGSCRKIYGCVVSRQDHYQRRDDGLFDAEEFEKYPERYISTFSTKIAPYASVVINGIYWAPNSPHLLTIPDAKRLLSEKPQVPWIKTSPGCPALPHRLLALCDISADPGGSIEFMNECTTIDRPFSLYDAEQNVTNEKFFGPGILVCSVDNMPAQVPREATKFFGSALFPYLMDMLKSDATKPFSEFNACPEVKNAVITSNGLLTPGYEYIAEMRSKRSISREASNKNGHKHRVLVLGAGFIVPSLIEYLSRDGNIHITIASNSKSDLFTVCDQFHKVKPEQVDILNDDAHIDQLIADTDLVISMVPWVYHPTVMGYCIKNKKNILTASYYTPKLKEMENEILESGITAFMEIGLDPGIDHLLAMECFDDIREHAGTIVSYKSYAGGLPAPECSDNALRYKFSWSPEAALATALNGAVYLKNGHIVEIPPGGELMSLAKKIEIYPGFNFEAYPNRDSTKYKKLYGLDDCETLIRGTIRYEGFTSIMSSLIALGLLRNTPEASLHAEGPRITWKEYMCQLMNLRHDVFTGTLKDTVLEKLGGDRTRFDPIEELGLFANEPIRKKGTPIATLAEYLSKPLEYGDNERDLIIMSHEVDVLWPDKRREVKHLRLVAYGQDGMGRAGLAMCRTVGLPAAIAAKMILTGEIQNKGIVLPLTPEIYRPILKRLKKEGIEGVERKIPVMTSLDNK